MNAGELKLRMAQQAAEIARHLLPQGKKASGEWKAGNTSGETGDSLSVRLTGAKAGVWKDFASGQGGDLLDLWMACHGLTLVEAMKEAKAFLGIREDFPKPPERTFQKPQKPQTKKPGGRVYEWLRSRGLTDETLEAFKVREVQRSGAIWARHRSGARHSTGRAARRRRNLSAGERALGQPRRIRG